MVCVYVYLHQAEGTTSLFLFMLYLDFKLTYLYFILIESHTLLLMMKQR